MTRNKTVTWVTFPEAADALCSMFLDYFTCLTNPSLPHLGPPSTA